MCSFACMKPVTNPSSTTLASTNMRILLRYGFCHTAVLNKDSNFFGVCREALDLYQINCHVLSGVNHNPLLVKQVNWYLNKGLWIMCNKQDLVQVALETILTSSCLEFVPCSRDRYFLQSCCCWTWVHISDRFLKREALGTDFFCQHSCLLLYRTRQVAVSMPSICRIACWGTMRVSLGIHQCVPLGSLNLLH